MSWDNFAPELILLMFCPLAIARVLLNLFTWLTVGFITESSVLTHWVYYTISLIIAHHVISLLSPIRRFVVRIVFRSASLNRQTLSSSNRQVRRTTRWIVEIFPSMFNSYDIKKLFAEEVSILHAWGFSHICPASSEFLISFFYSLWSESVLIELYQIMTT